MKNRTWRRWTEKEDEFVRSHYDKERPSWIAEQLGRTSLSIKQRAAAIQVRIRECRKWTSDEIALLQSEYSAIGAVGIAKKLGRTPQAVQVFANNNGLRYNASWTEEQIQVLRQRYPIEGFSTELESAIGHPRASIANKTSELGLSYDGPCKIRGKNKGSLSPNWKGAKSGDEDRFDVSGKVISTLRRNAKTREIAFQLSAIDIADKLREQNGFCAKTGHSISFVNGTASVDRIDSDGPYSKSNIRITTVMANICQFDYTDAEMDQFCLDYVRYKGLMPAPPAPTVDTTTAQSLATT